ncbi:MAG: penicillin-binding protein activator [Desulfobacterales bacterium]|jgi:ABC-type branched-subunit amino acid transport system substrate-binding protein
MIYWKSVYSTKAVNETTNNHQPITMTAINDMKILLRSMKACHIIILFYVLLVFSACVQKPPVSTESAQIGAEDELFAAAEKMFEFQDYTQSLEAYQDYVYRYPDRPFAPAALMKIGKINSILGRYVESRRAYNRLISEYPRSSFNPDARVEILFTLYQEGAYSAVIEQASEVLQSLDSASHIFRTYAMVGDAYLALGSPADAFKYYVEASQFSSELEKEAITQKIKTSIAQLDSAAIVELLKSWQINLPRDYLMFQLGLNYAMEEKYDEALVAFEKFINQYPQHENAALAENLIKQIKESALFNRYTIGCLLPLSGPYQAVGLRALKGLEFALERFSVQSSGPQMNIIVKDSQGDPGQTRLAMQELIEEKVAAIIGPIVTAEIAAAEAQASGIPIITLTQKDNVTSIGDYVFRNFITPEMQVKTLTDYITKSLGLNRFAILYPDETYGITFMNLFWDGLLESGGKVVGVEAYNPQHTDFADPIKKIVGLYYNIPQDLKEVTQLSLEEDEDQRYADAVSDPDMADENQEQKTDDEEPEAMVDFDAIFIPDEPKIAGLIIPQLAFYDVNDIYLLGTNLWHSDLLIEMAAQYVQGAIMPDGFFAESSEPAVQNFVQIFEETYQERPGFIEAVVYDTAMIIFGVLNKPDLRFKSELKNELLNMTVFSGITGPTYFDENGEAQKQLYLLKIKGRRFVELEQN